MIHIFNDLPKEYKTTVEVLERTIDYPNNKLTIETLRYKSTLEYKRIKSSKGYGNDEDEEKTVMMLWM